MLIQTFGVIVFFAWIAYILFTPADKVNLWVVATAIGVTMFCIGGMVLLTMYFVVIGAIYLLTKL